MFRKSKTLTQLKFFRQQIRGENKRGYALVGASQAEFFRLKRIDMQRAKALFRNIETVGENRTRDDSSISTARPR